MHPDASHPWLRGVILSVVLGNLSQEEDDLSWRLAEDIVISRDKQKQSMIFLTSKEV